MLNVGVTSVKRAKQVLEAGTKAIIDAIRNAKGGTVGDALAKVEAMPDMREHGGDRKSEDYQVDNINLKTKGGTDTEYTLRRLNWRLRGSTRTGWTGRFRWLRLLSHWRSMALINTRLPMELEIPNPDYLLSNS